MVLSKFIPSGSSISNPQLNLRDNVTEDPIDSDARRLIGTTRFEPRGDVKNILITGGAGFM